MESALKGKKILLGVSSSIACYKAVDLSSRLVKAGAAVQVLMTPTATEFVRPLSFEAITQRAVYHDMTRMPTSWEMEHIEFARWGEVMLVAPATATTLARMANGLASDAVSSTYLAYQGPVFVAPAMNHAMWSHPATQDNMRRLESRSAHVIMPEAGRLACGEVGVGRLADLDMIVASLEEFFSSGQALKGKKVVITNGPTREFFDPARFLSNPSTGKMGHALAAEAMAMGADVTLINGPVSDAPPAGAAIHNVTSAEEMLASARKLSKSADIVIFAAAVSDYRPAMRQDIKAKRADKKAISMELVMNPDIAATVGQSRKKGQLFVGFAAETHDIEAEAKRKLAAKNLDLIVANPIGSAGAGFGADTNQGMIIGRKGVVETIPMMSKRAMARHILALLASFK